MSVVNLPRHGGDATTTATGVYVYAAISATFIYLYSFYFKLEIWSLVIQLVAAKYLLQIRPLVLG